MKAPPREPGNWQYVGAHKRATGERRSGYWRKAVHKPKPLRVPAPKPKPTRKPKRAAVEPRRVPFAKPPPAKRRRRVRKPPTPGATWRKGHTRKDGVKVKGHWVKPARRRAQRFARVDAMFDVGVTREKVDRKGRVYGSAFYVYQVNVVKWVERGQWDNEAEQAELLSAMGDDAGTEAEASDPDVTLAEVNVTYHTQTGVDRALYKGRSEPVQRAGRWPVKAK